MTPDTKPRSISQLLEEFAHGLDVADVPMSRILDAFHERGFGFILLILALPMALPVPVPPGVNVLLATPLLLLTAQQMLGRRTIWLPASIKAKTIKAASLQTIIAKSLPWMRRLEFFSRPRLGFITQGMFSHLIGAAGLIMALAICVPFPLTNTVPSLGIALMALGVIMRDGLAVLAGMAIGFLWVGLLTWAFVTYGYEGFVIIKDAIKSFL